MPPENLAAMNKPRSSGWTAAAGQQRRRRDSPWVRVLANSGPLFRAGAAAFVVAPCSSWSRSSPPSRRWAWPSSSWSSGQPLLPPRRACRVDSAVVRGPVGACGGDLVVPDGPQSVTLGIPPRALAEAGRGASVVPDASQPRVLVEVVSATEAPLAAEAAPEGAPDTAEALASDLALLPGGLSPLSSLSHRCVGMGSILALAPCPSSPSSPSSSPRAQGSGPSRSAAGGSPGPPPCPLTAAWPRRPCAAGLRPRPRARGPGVDPRQGDPRVLHHVLQQQCLGYLAPPRGDLGRPGPHGGCHAGRARGVRDRRHGACDPEEHCRRAAKPGEPRRGAEARGPTPSDRSPRELRRRAEDKGMPSRSRCPKGDAEGPKHEGAPEGSRFSPSAALFAPAGGDPG